MNPKSFPKVNNLNTRLYLLLRHYSTLKTDASSGLIRKRFLDYFNKENDHSFIRSSPIVPHCDTSVPFVNAGMNQFKGIFLGLRDTTNTKVANTQKCARISGKHNDLDLIGHDGYHHTFFEMLGNWSFGNYFKKEACELAWNLLTGPYALDPRRLYITYFGGDTALNLEPDLECRDIWRNIGVSDEHILPYGVTDNFWEMGSTGPCGPCTEIHIDHVTAPNFNRAHNVNKGYSNLTELWNIVFIQYNRIGPGTIETLPRYHVDTGMGLERLVAVLQKRASNYDTDLFLPLFKTVHNNSKGGVVCYKGTFGQDEDAVIDTAYRILVDHSRLIAVCLADGMIPDQSPKLRRIMRRALILSEKYFNTDATMLKALSTTVADILGETYPELFKNINKIHYLIKHEEEVLQALRLGATKQWKNILETRSDLEALNITEFPGLVLGYKEIQNSIKLGVREISSELAYKLSDTYGFEKDVIRKLADADKINFDEKAFECFVNTKKSFSRQLSSKYTEDVMYNLVSSLQKSILPTDDSFKYKYDYQERYEFPHLVSRILAIIIDNQVVSQVANACECSLILDKSNFYCESGGQESDIGRIIFSDGIYFEVSNVRNINDYLVHDGKLIGEGTSDILLKIGDGAKLIINSEHRLNNMRNHTGVHMLNAAISKISEDCVVSQISSKVCKDYLNFGVAVYGMRLNLEHLKEIEDTIRKMIRMGSPVSTRIIDIQQLLASDAVTLIPGEVYPENDIRLVEIISSDFCSREACCGTHVLDVKHLEEFCLIKVQNVSRVTTVLRAVTGEVASEILHRSSVLEDKINKFLQHKPSDTKHILSQLNEIRAELISTANPISYITKTEYLMKIESLVKASKHAEHQNLQDFVDVEMRDIMDSVAKSDQKFLVHNLICSSLMNNVKLEKVTRYCKNKPVMIFSYSNGNVKARCCVPKELVTEQFDAQKWLETAAKLFKSEATPPKGQHHSYVCNMKLKRISEPEYHDLLEKAIKTATKYANIHFPKTKKEEVKK